MKNYDLKEQIRSYWSKRSESFDQSFSHKIEDGVELKAWKDVYAKLADNKKLDVLELGSGTGEVTKVLRELGHQITGIDFSENMLEKSKIKHQDHLNQVRYILGDAENTNQADDRYDLVTCRHLVWTLLDPNAALADWFRVTKPGGHLIVFDGDYMTKGLRSWAVQLMMRGLDRMARKPDVLSAEMRDEHDRIAQGLYFSSGLRFDALKALAQEAGYVDIKKHSYRTIHQAQRKIAGPRDWLSTFKGNYFIFHARKPLENSVSKASNKEMVSRSA